MPRVSEITVNQDDQTGLWIVAASAKLSPTGKRYRKRFKTKAIATADKKRIEHEKAAHGTAGTILAPDTATDAARATAILAPYGMTLTAAAEIAAKIAGQRAASITFAELYDEYIYNPKKTRRDKTLANYRDTYNRFEKLFGDRKISEITAGEIEKQLDGCTPEVARNHFIALRAWFNFAVRKGWAQSNPVLAIEIQQREQREIHTMSNADVEKLLTAAAAHYPALLPYVAFGTFCGIRPAELRRLRWEDVNLDDGFVTVTAESSKVKRRRNVEICEALKSWVEPHAKKSGAICDLSAMTFKRRWKACREKAGQFDGWVADGLRHTFASNHLAAHGNLAALQIETGHADLNMLRDHYLNSVPKKAALEFWQIVPAGAPKPKAIKAA